MPHSYSNKILSIYSHSSVHSNILHANRQQLVAHSNHEGHTLPLLNPISKSAADITQLKQFSLKLANLSCAPITSQPKKTSYSNSLKETQRKINVSQENCVTEAKCVHASNVKLKHAAASLENLNELFQKENIINNQLYKSLQKIRNRNTETLKDHKSRKSKPANQHIQQKINTVYIDPADFKDLPRSRHTAAQSPLLQLEGANKEAGLLFNQYIKCADKKQAKGQQLKKALSSNSQSTCTFSPHPELNADPQPQQADSLIHSNQSIHCQGYFFTHKLAKVKSSASMALASSHDNMR